MHRPQNSVKIYIVTFVLEKVVDVITKIMSTAIVDLTMVRVIVGFKILRKLQIKGATEVKHCRKFFAGTTVENIGICTITKNQGLFL